MIPNQQEVTDRVRVIFEELKKQGKVRFNRDYLGWTGMSEGNISSMLNPFASRPVNFPKKFYGELIERWKINKDYFLSGTGNMFADEPEAETVQSILIEIREELKKINEYLKKAK